MTLRATPAAGGTKTWSRVRKTVAAAGVHTVSCNLGRKGRAKLRRAPLKLTLRADLVADDGSPAQALRKLTIRRKR